MSQATQTRPSYDEAIASLSNLIPELLGLPGQPRRKFSLDEISLLSAALGNPHRKFPSVLVAGTNGKGSTSATLAAIARASGLRVGLYTSPHLARVNERIRLLAPSNPANVGAPGLALETGEIGDTGETGETGDIPDQTFADLYFRVLEAAQSLVARGQLAQLPSYFEHLTALAFLYFAESQVDLAVLEVGMGGRLDATNLVDPVLSVITDIALDHQEWLGSTIALIAREKAGILRQNGTLVTLPQHPEANQSLGEVAVALNVRGVSAAEYTPATLHPSDPNAPYPIQVMGHEIRIDSPLKGVHQHRNIALAVAAAVELAENHRFPITPASIEQGIRRTRWPGRLESLHIPNQPEWILDVAHNPAGAWALRAALNSTNPGAPGLASETGDSNQPKSHLDSAEGPGSPGLASETGDSNRPKTHLDSAEGPGAPGLASETGDQSQVLIFACLRDKPLREMTQILFPIFDHIVLAPIHSPRANDVADLLAAAESTGIPSTAASTVAQALQIARNLRPARIVISGSVYLVGEARTLLLNAKGPAA